MDIQTEKLKELLETISVEDTKRDFKDYTLENKIDPKKKYRKPPIAVSIGLNDRPYNGRYYPQKLFSYGDISLLTGEEKSRKSFLMSLVLACSIGGRADDYHDEIKGHDINDKYVIQLDSEQSQYDGYLNHKRIPEMVGCIPDNYIYIRTRELSNKERSQYLEWLFMESEYRKKLAIVSIDGHVDFCKNFNDLEESQNYVSSLLKYSSLTHSHITGVLHLNHGSDKSRGHLGTILQQKSECVMMIKDKGKYSEVICKSMRGAKRFNSFGITVNDNYLPELYSLNDGSSSSYSLPKGFEGLAV